MRQNSEPVYWGILHDDHWTISVAATERGVCCITLPDETYDSMEQWVQKNVTGATLTMNQEKVSPYLQQLQEYFDGHRQTFSIPLDLRGTPFQLQVWNALMKIPFGSLKRYSEVASDIGRPTAVRATGAANGANPVPFVVPCHRVIGKNGTLTGYRGGLNIKAALLTLEGHVSLARYLD